ncbi:hypothetical protein MHU86_14791 [Fragilaria crotonensis]|nr:hypothetical protein MHU86_14791 [Fragilaria crotonensis]
MNFLVLVTGPGNTLEVTILHRFMRYLDMPGEQASGFHDQVLGLQGDIMPHQYPAVEVPNSVFHLVQAPVRVPTVAAMAVLMPTWEDPSVPLGPFTDADPETEVVRPRNVQLLPGHYASLIIHRRRMSAKVVYQELYGSMLARDEVAACTDVLIWLRAACTARGGGGAQNGSPCVHYPLTAVHLPEQVYRYLIGKVRADLPALGDPDPATAEVTGTLAGALRALTNARPGREGTAPEERATVKEPKLLQDVYRETYRTLLRFCNVSRPEDVAPLWGRLANCAKSEQHTLLTQEFHRVCQAKGLDTALYTPIITTGLKQMIIGFMFVGHGVDDLSSGCQPFMVAYSGTANHLEALAVSSVSNQLAQGDQAASLHDYTAIKEKEKLRFPRDTMDVAITLTRYAVLCQALFQGVGATHPFVERIWQLVAAINNATPYITDRFQQVAGNPNIANVYFPCIVRSVQVNVFEYMHTVSTNLAEDITGVELPEFRSLVTELKRGTFPLSANWVPLPLEYMATSRAGNSGSGGRVSTSVPGSASTVSTGVSTLTAGTARASQPEPHATRVQNPTHDAEFTGIAVRPGGTRPAIRAHRPPANDAGHEFCLAWWLRGACFDNCGRAQTHANFASAAERTRLLAYCREHVAAPSASNTSA